MFPQEITRVFLNLISNGFYAATKRKGEATVTRPSAICRRDQVSRPQRRDEEFRYGVPAFRPR